MRHPFLRSNTTFPLLFLLAGGAIGVLTGAWLEQPVKHGAARQAEASPAGLPLAKANTLVSGLTHGKAAVTRTFAGPAGLTGIVIDRGGLSGNGSPSEDRKPMVAWMTDSGSAIIVGGVVDTKTNRNLTMTATDRYVLHQPGGTQPNVAPLQTVSDTKTAGAQIAAASPTSPEASLQAFLRRAGGLTQVPQPGLDGPHTLYAFVDPNCIFCHDFFMYILSHETQFRGAGVRVVYLPVAVLKQSSIAKAAEIARDGWPALNRNERRFDANTEEGGIQGLSGDLLARYAAPVHENSRIMEALAQAQGAQPGTPFLVWEAANGRGYYIDGMPNAHGIRAILDSMQSGWNPPAGH